MLSSNRKLKCRAVSCVHYFQIRSFAVYVNTLFQIIKRDIVQFLIVFIVITVSFGGGLYFSLRADTCRLSADRMTTDEVEFSPVTNTSLCLHPNETRCVQYNIFIIIYIAVFYSINFTTVKYTYHG